MDNAIEVLKKHIESIREYAEYPNKQLINSLDEALLALEQKERLEKWLNEKIVESEKYPDTQEPAYYYRRVLELMK